MKKNNLYRGAALLFVALAVSAVPVAGEAQFLKKVSKGLDKLNNKLEKVESTLNGDKNKNGNKAQNNSASQPAQNGKQPSADFPVLTARAGTPYITPATRYMRLQNLYDDTVSDVFEGVFTIKSSNATYSFWTIDGKCLFGPEWKTTYTSGAPRFDSGVAVAISTTKKVKGRDVYSLLYLDGSVKELDPNWTGVSQFIDGIALVEQTVNYKKSHFFINPRGEKIFPALNLAEATVNPLRPLVDGLRAVYMKSSGIDYAWGFIDAKGNVVIAPKYYMADNFHGGYCWVTKKGQTGRTLIDTKGNEVYTSASTKVSPVGDGIFYIEEHDGTAYYDVTGKQLSKQVNGSGFFQGHAFIGDNRIQVSMVDTDFNILKTFSDKILNGTTTSQHGPHFGPAGLATYLNLSGNFVIDGDGNIVLQDWSADYGKHELSEFGQFQKSGYAKIKQVKIDYNRYLGLMDTKGRIVWLFGTGDTPDCSILPIEPIEPDEPDEPGQPGHPLPPYPQPIDPETPPVGPKVRTEHTYSIKVQKEGEGTVGLSASSAIKYGDPVTLTAVPAEHWALAYIECSPRKNITAGEPFAVTSDMTVTVKFVKEEDIEPVAATGAYLGTLHIEENKPGEISDDIPVYAELSREADLASPYGEKTSGFLVVMFDPTKLYSTPTVETRIFCAPLKVAGSQKDEATGREWLVVEGGSVTFGNLKIKPGDPMAALYMNMAMAFDGHSSPQCTPRRYRIEILDRDTEKDEFTFGELQTYSTKAGGWVEAQSKVLRETTRGVFVTKVDKGFDAALVAGTRMKPAQKRTDISWYPPLLWYKNNENTLQDVITRMGNAYRAYQSDYDRLFQK